MGVNYFVEDRRECFLIAKMIIDPFGQKKRERNKWEHIRANPRDGGKMKG